MSDTSIKLLLNQSTRQPAILFCSHISYRAKLYLFRSNLYPAYFLMKKILIATLLLYNFIQASELIPLLSIPKCGTNLVIKLLSNLTGKKLINEIPKNWGLLLNPSKINLQSGIMWSHAIYTEQNAALLAQHNLKAIFIYRDPRDHIISMMNYIKDKRTNTWPDYINMPVNKFITLMIKNYSWIANSPSPLWSIPAMKNLKGIDSFYTLYLPWRYHPNTYATQFEKLVGPKGGGTEAAQLNEIKNIAAHLGISLTHEKAKTIASNIFGGSHTFKFGQIGSWKKYFNQEYKELFKKHAGQLLIDLGYEKDFNW